MTPTTRRDLVVLTVLLLLALTSVLFELQRASAPGPSARVAMNREVVNRGAWSNGTLPLWDPYEFGGRPHLADPRSLSLYPPHLLLWFLPLPLFFSLSFALHTWLAGTGTYFAARVLGAPRSVSALASCAVVVGRLVVPLEARAYSPDVYGLAWLPLIAACSLRSARSPGWLPDSGLIVAATLGLIASALNPTYVLATLVGCYLFVAIWLKGGRRHLLLQPLVVASLASGLAAVQILPTVRFLTTMRGDHGLVADIPSPEPPHSAHNPPPQLVESLRSLAGSGRILSTCGRAIDGRDFVSLGVPGVGGSGGVYSGDYGRFTQTVRGATERTRPSFEGIPEASNGPARADLLALLGVEYLVACDPPNAQRWSLIGSHDGVGIYRSASPVPRAFWTCAPLPVGPREMEYRLRHSSYDANLVLQPHLIFNVRWPAGITDADRARTESALRLAPHRDIADRTWEYDLLDRSPENVAAIVGHPLVEDTQGIDRVRMLLLHSPAAVPTFDEPKSERLMGVDSCGAPVPVTVREQDRFDGLMTVEVNAPQDGIVFFSETYYRDRRARVDGRRIGRLRVNLASTGVPVSAGRHRIELSYDTRSFWWGAALSVLTLIAWLHAERRVRQGAGSIRRRAPSFSSVST
jgi:hypothetical protein